MPNICSNTVRLCGNEETVTKIVDAEFSFQKLLPCPYLQENTEPTDEKWYDWCTEHWGTKWDRNDYKVLGQGATGLKVDFSTAWCPPLQFLTKMIEQNKDLWIHCEWFEEGGMAGVFIASWDKKENKLSVKDLEWEDWCMEEYAHHFRKQN